MTGTSILAWSDRDSVPTGSAGNGIPAGTAGNSIPAWSDRDNVPTGSAGNSILAGTAGNSIPAGSGGNNVPAESAGNSIPASAKEIASSTTCSATSEGSIVTAIIGNLTLSKHSATPAGNAAPAIICSSTSVANIQEEDSKEQLWITVKSFIQ